jgi:putative ABC transport system permease protein
MTGMRAVFARRWRAVTGAASAATIAIGVLVLGCAGVAMAGPRGAAMLETNAVRQLVAQTPPSAEVVEASDGYTQVAAPLVTVTSSQLATVGTELRSNLAGVPLAGSGSDLMAFTTGFGNVTDRARSLGPHTGAQLELVYQTGLASHARVLQGTLPTSFRPTAGIPTFPIAVTIATARRYGLKVGSELPLAITTGNATLRVSAVIEPVRPSDPFWSLDTIQDVPAVVATQETAVWEGGAFIAAAELAPAERMLGTTASVRWVLPLRLGNITGSQATKLSTTLPAAVAQAGGDLQVGPSTTLFTATMSTGMTNVLTTFAQQVGSVTTLLSLLSVSLTAVCAAVLLLAVWLLAEQRFGEFSVLRARGASRRQLAWLAVRGCLPTVLPGAVVGVVVAIVLTPGNGAELGWWLSGLTVVVVLAGLPVLTVRQHKWSGPASWRADAPVGRRAGVRRLLIEAVLVLASAGGLVVLRVQGLAQGGDVYTSLAPVLVAVPLAVLVLRCYPWLARPVLVLSGRRHGVAGFVGLARAIRTAVTAGLPVFALVLALALVGFGGMVRGAVERGEVLASWQSVGADAVVSDPAGLSAAAQHSIATAPGVQRTAAVTVGSATLAGNTVGVVGVNPEQYGTLVASIPGSQTNANALGGVPGGAVPALATPGLAGSLIGPSTLEVNGQPVSVRLAGQVTATSALSSAVTNLQYFVLPRDALGGSAGPPTVMLVVGAGLNQRAMVALVHHLGGHASVSFRSSVLAGLQKSPLQHGAYLAFALASVVAGVLSVLVLLLALVIGGRSRQLTLARLNTMGLSAGQGRRLAILEVVPQVLAAVVGGAASAALLAPLVGPTLDLSVFTGSSASVPVDIEPEFLAAAVLALAVLALLTLAVQTMVAGRTTAGALRIGG